MTDDQSAWVFNLALRLAVVVCLSTLALGLIVGVGPLTALLRSGTAFGALALLGRAASLVWAAPATEEVAVEPEDHSIDSASLSDGERI